MTRSDVEIAAARYRLSGTFARKSLQLLRQAVSVAPWLFLAATLSAAVFSLLTVLFGNLLGQITDDVIIPGVAGEPIGGVWGEFSQDPLEAAALAGGAFIAIGLVMAVFVAGRRGFQGMAVARVGGYHRGVVADAISRLPLGWHRTHSSGRILSAMSSDSETATSPLHPLAFTVGSFVMLIAAGYSMWQADPWLAVTGLSVVPVILVINVFYERVITPKWNLGQTLRADVSAIAHESFDGGTVVKALGAERREGARFEKAARELADADTRVGSTTAWFEPLMDLMAPLGALALAAVGTYRASTGDASVGDVVAAMYLVTLLAVPIRGIGWILGQMPQALVSFRRIGEIVSAAVEIDEPGHLQVARSGAASIRFESAHIGADDGGDGQLTVIMEDVTIELEPGTVTALVGPTGSGKSTLALAASRLASPAAGSVKLDGVNLAHIANLATHVALVPQSAFVFAGTVRENVTLGEDFSDAEVWEALRRAAVDSVIESLAQPGDNPLDAVLDERGMNLSGGQRQRLALARALVRRPRVLILDDATSAVDPQVEREILTGLKGSDDSPTVLLVAYRLASILLADRVVRVDDGRIVDAGTHEELMARDTGYQDLVLAYERDAERQRLATVTIDNTADAAGEEG